MIESIKMFREYLDYIEEHYNNVQKAWRFINDRCKNKGFNFLYDDSICRTLDANVERHDMSKLSPEEFTQYRQYFFPTEEEKREAARMGISSKMMFKNDFNKAWEHHKKNNPHHWETWTEYADSSLAEIYLIENIIDWIAMGFKFGDTAKDYYERNKDEIVLPEWAIEYMYDIFECLYS